MTYQINSLERNDYVELLELWEASVRASHDFLQESDIMYFKPLILNTYFDAVALRGVKGATGEILGFLGVADQNLEMLFVHPDAMGKGIGRCLLSYAVSELEVKKVDVNEQNPQALAFYQRFGFKVIGRSELDGTGKPYPILHLEL
ncbi:GNAT family N-acetyltransferase [Algoriphagus halophytocola]|uniref:GNAT family N-acetyltransferase n=1 Tax=Algoriphagus halophytocola TaxID=2991499 RepID=UPI0022DDCCEA|nr:GNAT family N-acetyltransferase [Algoriphagus sp. TR-M9]WBL44748.1 GNAT family N-acetyltransferase [Algoriphagus sp. TR-M9]